MTVQRLSRLAMMMAMLGLGLVATASSWWLCRGARSASPPVDGRSKVAQAPEGSEAVDRRRKLDALGRAMGLLAVRGSAPSPASDPAAPATRPRDDEVLAAVREELESRLAGQASDAVSEQEARTIRAVLATSISGRGEITECVCGAELCRAVVVAGDEVQGRLLQGLVAEGAAEREMLFAHGESMASTTLYIARSGKRLPIGPLAAP
jgi:hypothetical protein